MTYGYTDHLPTDFTDSSLRCDVLAGLTATPKWLPPKWFYDKNGSALFEEITRLPEYYPTRTERAILESYAEQIVGRAGGRQLVELGSGSSEKTRLLLDQLPAEGSSYLALDVSESALRTAGEVISLAYPQLRVETVRADFEGQLPLVLSSAAAGAGAAGDREGGRLVAFLGGTIGNLVPLQRRAFLAEVRAGLSGGDTFLLGADLVKSPEVLVPAYDDQAGVTAAFNLNVLEVLNRRLAADFQISDFEHVALWDAENAWIEMRLRALRPLTVRICELDLAVDFEAGEELRTEISAKFTRDRLVSEFEAAGFVMAGWWTDPEEMFSLSLWSPA
jgi:L-histidine N-alpha-methyltransferase